MTENFDNFNIMAFFRLHFIYVEKTKFRIIFTETKKHTLWPTMTVTNYKMSKQNLN